MEWLWGLSYTRVSISISVDSQSKFTPLPLKAPQSSVRSNVIPPFHGPTVDQKNKTWFCRPGSCKYLYLKVTIIAHRDFSTPHIALPHDRCSDVPNLLVYGFNHVEKLLNFKCALRYNVLEWLTNGCLLKINITYHRSTPAVGRQPTYNILINQNNLSKSSSYSILSTDKPWLSKVTISSMLLVWIESSWTFKKTPRIHIRIQTQNNISIYLNSFLREGICSWEP